MCVVGATLLLLLVVMLLMLLLVAVLCNLWSLLSVSKSLGSCT